MGGSPYSAPVVNPVKTTQEFQPLPYALSSVYLMDLAKREEQVHQRVQEYLVSLEERVALVKEYLRDYEDSLLLERDEVDVNSTAELIPTDSAETLRAIKITASPVRSFRMIRRFAQDLNAIDKHIREDAEASFLDAMQVLQGNHNWPSEDDIYDVMDGILRIHFFYKLNVTEFADGRINGTETGVKLTTRQCWTIAQFAIRWQFYTLAFEWLDVTRYKLRLEKEEDRWPGLTEEIINVAERRTREHHDKNFEDQREKRSPFIFLTPIGREKELPKTMRQHLFENYLGRDWGNEPDYSFINFVALCNGYNFQNDQEKHDLKCWYEKDRHPYFKINPLKMELLHREPYLVQIYDFLGEQWTDVLRRAGGPMLERAPPRNHAKATPRTATYAWLPDEDFAEINLIKKMEAFSGLNVATEKASERLQIASYTFGGHVGTHVDSLGTQAHLDEKGDRIFTLLLYLNDVERGGLTAFPVLGTSVKPLKGSAVFWYDSLKNGEVDGRMLHGACPLILGQKWIGTKWTHQNENMFKWPCSLNPDE